MSAGREFYELAETTLAALRVRGWMVATAESCTGGLIAGALTEVSRVVGCCGPRVCHLLQRGKKRNAWRAGGDDRRTWGGECGGARAMAEGALARSRAHVAIAVTGIAGPDGGSADKPVGLVWFGCATAGDDAEIISHIFNGDRSAIRAATVVAAMAMLRKASQIGGAVPAPPNPP